MPNSVSIVGISIAFCAIDAGLCINFKIGFALSMAVDKYIIKILEPILRRGL